MQRVEFEHIDHPLHCPFCGQRTIGGDEGPSPCAHTLFIATDEVLEYCSSLVNKRALLKRAEEDGWEEATDELEYPRSVKFALYFPSPSFYGTYIGYAAPSPD